MGQIDTGRKGTEPKGRFVLRMLGALALSFGASVGLAVLLVSA